MWLRELLTVRQGGACAADGSRKDGDSNNTQRWRAKVYGRGLLFGCYKMRLAHGLVRSGAGIQCEAAKA
jgi:hypothetical protein